MAPSPARLYRVVEGPHAGEIVGDDDSCECDVCDGSGVPPFHERAPNALCPQCMGVGRVLGYPSAYEAIRLAEVTSEELARRGTQADETTRTRADLPRQASSGSVDRAVRAAVHRR